MKATATKRMEAEQRQEARGARSDREQLDRLYARGAGRCREAVRLQARLFGMAS